MTDDNRTRFDALIDIVAEYTQEGLPPNPEWFIEINAISARHPEWVPPPPPLPPPTVVYYSTPPPPPAPPPPRAAVALKPGRVLIDVDTDIERIQTQVLKILGERLAIYQNGGRLLELQIDPGEGIPFLTREIAAPRMLPINATRAWSLAGQHCTFGSKKVDAGGTEVLKEIVTPEWIGRALISRSNLPHVPIFSAMAQAPTLRADGALLWESGYDTSTGIFLMSNIQVAVPPTPTVTDAQAAFNRIIDLVTDFDFVNPAGKSVWLAGLLAVVCRHTFDGPVPIIIIDASKRGSGKTMLADLASMIATGSTAPRMVYVADDIEMDKRISALALCGDQMVLMDNIVGKLASPSLDAALTSTTYRGRILGKSEMTAALSMKSVWWATGNGMIIGADTARRALLARLEVDCDFPENRTGPRPGILWKYPSLLAHAKRYRAAILSDCLTLVSAYVRAGRPNLRLTPMGSFEGWSETIRNAIVWAGGADPCDTTVDVRKADLEDLALRAMVECWPVDDGVTLTAASLLDWATTVPPMSLDGSKREQFERSRSIREMWRNALLEWCPPKKLNIDRPGLPTALELGHKLKNIDGSIIGEFKICGGEHTKSGVPWSRVRVGPQKPEKDEKHDDRAKLSLIK